MDPTRTQVTAQDGVTYTFRLPNGMDFIEIDLKARQLRQGVTDGLAFGFGFSQNIALLNHLCVGPEGTDFAKLPFYITENVSDEVTKWIDSFRKPVGKEQGTMDKAESH